METENSIYSDKIRHSNETDHRVLLAGGLAGLTGVIFYLVSQFSPLHDIFHGFPVQASQSLVVLAFWMTALMKPLGIVGAYAVYRLLAQERQGAVNQLAFVFAVSAFVSATIHGVVQDSAILALSQSALEAPLTEREVWRKIMIGLNSIDLGIDLAWDLYLGLWMILAGALMLKHSAFGPGWGVSAIVIAVPFLIFNAVAVPWPPVIDLGPVVGIYWAFLCGYMIRIGLARRSVPEMAASTSWT